MSRGSWYWPGQSWLHHVPVGAKFGGLLVLSLVVVFVDHVLVLPGAAVAVCLVLLSTRIPVGVVGRALFPLLLMAAIVAAGQAAFGRFEQAYSAGLGLATTAAAAVAVTLSTRSTAVVAWVEGMLRRLRVRERSRFTFGLLVGIALRSLEHLAQVAARVLDARRARGLQRSWRAFAVPTVVAAARYAHGVGEALEARGIADPDGAETEAT